MSSSSIQQSYRQARDAYIESLFVDNPQNPFRNSDRLLAALASNRGGKSSKEMFPPAERKYCIYVAQQIQQLMAKHNVDKDPILCRGMPRRQHNANAGITKRKTKASANNNNNNNLLVEPKNTESNSSSEVAEKIITFNFDIPLTEIPGKEEIKQCASYLGSLIQTVIVPEQDSVVKVYISFRGLSNEGLKVMKTMEDGQTVSIEFRGQWYPLHIDIESVSVKQQDKLSLFRSNAKIQEEKARIEARKQKRLELARKEKEKEDAEQKEKEDATKHHNHGIEIEDTNSIATTIEPTTSDMESVEDEFNDDLEITNRILSVLENKEEEKVQEAVDAIQAIFEKLFSPDTMLVQKYTKLFQQQELNTQFFKEYSISTKDLCEIGVKLGHAVKIVHEINRMKIM